ALSAGVGELQVSFGGVRQATIDISGTGSWGTYQEFAAEGIELAEGTEVIMRLTTTGGFNLNRIRFEAMVLSLQDYLPLAEGISVYPNPTKAQVSVSLPDQSPVSSLELYSISGQLIKQSGSSGLDLVELPIGSYWLVINRRYLTQVVRE
ncbi:MAG TPA: hypothetical protein DCE41_19585, partial [Cytophagales bacterium]|nr:hypothetical protein [Cytophagales bacterium]